MKNFYLLCVLLLSSCAYAQQGTKYATELIVGGGPNNSVDGDGAKIEEDGDFITDGDVTVGGQLILNNTPDFDAIDVGGGYGDTGLSINSSGTLTTNSSITSDTTVQGEHISSTDDIVAVDALQGARLFFGGGYGSTGGTGDTNGTLSLDGDLVVGPGFSSGGLTLTNDGYGNFDAEVQGNVVRSVAGMVSPAYANVEADLQIVALDDDEDRVISLSNTDGTYVADVTMENHLTLRPSASGLSPVESGRAELVIEDASGNIGINLLSGAATGTHNIYFGGASSNDHGHLAYTFGASGLSVLSFKTGDETLLSLLNPSTTDDDETVVIGGGAEVEDWLSVGDNDTQPSYVSVFGGSGTIGGDLRLYNGAIVDDEVNYWSLGPDLGGDFNISSSGGTLGAVTIIEIDDDTGDVVLNTNLDLQHGSTIITPGQGTYTPTINGLVNITSPSSITGRYHRIGPELQVFVKFTATITAATTATTFEISLPVVSNLTASINVIGDGMIYKNSTTEGSPIFAAAETTNETVICRAYPGFNGSCIFTLSFACPVQ